MDKFNKKKPAIRDNLIFLGFFAAAAAVLLIFPGKKPAAVSASWTYLQEMLVILPAVMVIMGLFSVFVSKEQVVKYLGKHRGSKGL